MKHAIPALLIALFLGGSIGSASAQAVQISAGQWIYDSQGNTVGSIRSLADGGKTAVVMVGTYFRPGSHEARLPVSDLSTASGQVTVTSEGASAFGLSSN